MSIKGLEFNMLRAGQNGSQFAVDIFYSIFLCEKVWISNKISQEYVPLGLIDKSALVLLMARIICRLDVKHITVLVVNNGISNTNVLEIP